MGLKPLCNNVWINLYVSILTTIWQDFFSVFDKQAQCSVVAIVQTSKILLKNLHWQEQICQCGILFLKLFWPTVRKNWSSDREKLLKFEAENFLRSLEFFFQAVRTIFGNRKRYLLTSSIFQKETGKLLST